MATVDVAGGQTPLLTVQAKIFGPAASELTTALVIVGFMIVPMPVISDQVPLPILGVTALRVAVVAQMVWSAPAVDDGKACLTTVTLDAAGGQTPFDTCH
jgi:hypothetical protein